MADRDVSFTAEWTKNLEFRKDPNRAHRAAGDGYMPVEPRAPQRSHVESNGAEHSYYDISMLKAPVWGWEIATYFYLGGISAGAYLIAHAALRADSRRFSDVGRAGSYLSFLTLLPCPPLLIHDLGDPARFYHMLRIWKPSSPMNLGTWTLTAYSGAVTADVVKQYLNDHTRLDTGVVATLQKLMNNGTLLLLRDAAGAPLALLVAGYTGALLSCTANPLWCRNPWLSPMFTSSAIATGAEALSLTLDLTPSSDAPSPSSQKVLHRIATAAHAVEGIAMAGFMHHAGEKAQALRSGKQAAILKLSIGATVAAEALKALPTSNRMRKPIRMLASLLGLGGAFGLRWAMVHAGHDAAANPHTARLVSKPCKAPEEKTRMIAPDVHALGGRRLPRSPIAARKNSPTKSRSKSAFNPAPVSVTMRTPGHDAELAAGFPAAAKA